jgi:hypothetical protein
MNIPYLQLIKEARSYVGEDDIGIDIDDVVEFLGDAIPPILSAGTGSIAQSELDAQPEMPQIIIEFLRNLVQWMNTKQKFEVSI